MDDFKKTATYAWMNRGSKLVKYLVFTKEMWLLLSKEKTFNFSFSNEQLDKAEKSENGFISKVNDCECYISINLPTKLN